MQPGRRKRMRLLAALTEEEEGAPASAQQPPVSQHWRKLRKGFRHAVEKMKNEEMRVAYLSHGLQHLRRVVLTNPVRHVAHQPLAHTFVVLDAASTLHFLKEDGTYRECRKAPAPVTGLLYAAQGDRFVAWGEWALQVLDGGLQPLSSVRSAQPIHCAVYSARLNRVVTAGPGNLTLWDFRYGSRSLQCRAAVCEGLSPQDVFSHLALDTGSVPQRCFACCDSGAAAFDISAGKLLSFQKELHSRAITDITYCEAIGSAVTASRDTTIKAWDEDWHVQTVFVGHTAPVVAVTAYPQRPLLFSASQDGTIRTWNLNTIDQVDQVHVTEPVEALETQSASHVISLSGPSLNFWRISKLYCLHTPLGSPAVRLHCFDLRALGDFPVRALCVCRDGSVRLLEAESGRPCSTLSLERPGQAHAVGYCLPLETLFVLTARGDLLRVNAAVDPMAVKKSTPAGAWDSRPGCLLLYSHTVDAAAAHSTWLQVAENKGLRKPWQKLPLPMQDKNRYLVILGHQSGVLSVVEWFSGRVQYTVAAHGPMPVTALAEYPTQTCVISAGADLTVKMWRLFPYAEEALLPLLCFSCSCPATHMCALGETLAVAFQDPETVTYSVVFYNLMRQTRAEHSPEDDAQDTITGLCHCPNLKLFASASRDGSVKVWDAKNRLLRHLKLNSIPESLAFANPRGDLLVGIERHLYLIRHDKYLPSYYKMKLLCARFLEPLRDVPLPLSAACFERLVQENVRRLKEEPPLEGAESPLPAALQGDAHKPELASSIPDKEFAQLVKNNEDLQLLRKGKLSAAKKLRVSRKMKVEAFEKYLEIFHKKPLHPQIPREDTFNADEVLEALRQAGSVSELYGPQGNVFLGCFEKPSAPTSADQLVPEDSAAAFPDSLSSSWLKARSVVLAVSRIKLALSPTRRGPGEQAEQAEELSPRESVAPPLPPWSPPVVAAPSSSAPAPAPAPDEAQKEPPTLRGVSRGLRLAARVPAPVRVGMPGQKMYVDVDLTEEDEGPPPAPPPAPPAASPSVGSAKSAKSVAFTKLPGVSGSQEAGQPAGASLGPRSQASPVVIKGSFPERQLLAKKWPRPQRPESREGAVSGLSSGFLPGPGAIEPLHSHQDLAKERVMRVIGPQEEPASPPGIGALWGLGSDVAPEEEEDEAPAAGISTPSSKTSLPEVFLTQLDESQYAEPGPGLPWSLLDAECLQTLFPEGLPPELDLREVVSKLLAAMLTADAGTNVALLGFVVRARDRLAEETKAAVHDTLIYLLNRRGEGLSVLDRAERRFVLAALRALVRLKRDSKDLMEELMAYYLKSPRPVRAAIKDLIQELGIQDPHDYFFREMESWPTEGVESKEALREACQQWLEGMMRELQEHRSSLLGLGAPSGGKDDSAESSPEEQLGDLTDAEEEAERTSSSEQFPEELPAEGEGSDDDLPELLERKNSLQRFWEARAEAPRWTRFVRARDAVCYFIDKQLARELAEQERLRPPGTRSLRDTVVALPPIQKRPAILRLGETNAMLRKRVPERFYFPYIFSRYVMKGFVPFVKLPLPRIPVGPFLPPPRRPASPRTFAAAQQLVQRYFIPKVSYADSYP